MASYFRSSVVFSRAEGECKYSVISGLIYISYSPVVSQDAAILAPINVS